MAHLRPILAYLGAILAQFRPKVCLVRRKPTPRPQKIIDCSLVFQGFFGFSAFSDLCQFLVRIGPHFASLLGSITAHLGAILAPSGPIWAHLGPSWCHLGAMFALLGPILAHLGPSWLTLAPSWRHLGPSWLTLAPSWPHLGPILAHLGSILAPFWSILPDFGTILASSWPAFRSFWEQAPCRYLGRTACSNHFLPFFKGTARSVALPLGIFDGIGS